MRTDRRGFALLATLWLVVAIGVVGLEWGLRARDQRRVALNTVDAVAARAAAEGGIALVRSRLDLALVRTGDLSDGFSAGDPGARLDPWRDLAAAVPETAWVAEGIAVRIRVEDAGARLDLNRAGEEELRRLMGALRVDAGLADRVAQSIADWRDADRLHRPRGAERSWYEEAGRLVLPADAPFRSVAELGHVKDVTPGLFETVAPYLAVGGTGRVNLLAAPRPVLLALPGISPEVAAVLERYRLARRPLPSLMSLEPELSPASWAALAAELPRLLARTTTETQDVRVRSEGRVASGVVAARAEALVVRSGGAAFTVRLEVTP